MADIHKDRVIASMDSLWTSQMYSDMTICCGSEEYKVHRAIICPRSTFCAAACRGEFIEAKTATIAMNDDDPETIKRMLLYLYKLDYPDEDIANLPADHLDVDRSLPPHLQCSTSASIEEETDLGTTTKLLDSTYLYDPRMMNNVLVYAVAEKYDVPELKELAKRKFQILANSKWPHDDFHAITELIFSTTPEEDMGLRQIVIDICREHFQDILKDEESKAAFLNNKNIAATVLDAAVQKHEKDQLLLDEALAKQIALKDQLSKAKADLREAVDEKDTWMSRLDSIIKRADNFTECRHCHERFQWCLERWDGFGGLGMRLRCASCRTKENL